MEDLQLFGLNPLNASRLDSFLRGLLFDDCVITRALQNHVVAKVRVSVEEQVRAPVPARYAPLLEVRSGFRAVRRRVAIKVDGSAAPMLLAESFVIPERLPAGFLASLATRAEGIGVTLEDLQVPARRDLVCWGLSDVVPWRPRFDVGPVVVRLYRFVTDTRPVILMYEAFLVEVVRGRMSLHLRDDSTPIR